eukprot:TRINITY_DN1479_c0_g1_i9.p1 TRINITY_DN1479_c0_g1~~TRINITY_DN1479_c0_g1_i9.p1  ORF type:complete len:959 (+),score=148.01 TRINITY_DN1479_c0_g1_i9:1722-4598(+)
MWAWLAAVGGAAALPLWDSDLLCPFRATSPALCEGSGFEECFWNDPVEDCLYGESDNTYNAVMWRRCSDDQCIAEMWRRVVPVDICTPYPVRHNNSQWHIYIQGSCQNSGVKMRLFETWKECVSAVPDFGGNGYNATLGIQVMPEGTSPPEDMTLVAVDHTHYGLAGQLFNGATLKTRYDLISCYIPVPFDAVADDNCGYRSRLGCAIKPSCVLDFPDTKTYGCAVGPATGPKSGRTVLTRVDTPNRTTDEAGTVVIKISAWLSRPPLGADTVFTVEANDTNEAFVEPSTLTFNEFNYAVEQTVIIWGADDDVIDGMTAYEVTFSVNATDDTEYSSMHPVSLQFWNADDDVAEVLFSVTANETSEVGAPAPALVVVGLASAPAGACVLAVNTNDTTEGYATPERLTFNGTSWSDLQMVTVVGVDDADADGDTAFLLTLSIYDCDDAQYSALAPSAIVFVNLDNDVALPVTPSPQTPAPQTASPVTASPLTPAPQTASPESQAGVLTEVFGGHITSESGQRAVIQVRLAAALAGTAPTVLTFLTSHDGEGEAIPSTVTYTSASWSQSQNVTVQGVDDDIPDGDVEYEISIHVTDSGDQSYLDLEPTYLTFTNLDNDTLVSTTSQAAASTTSQTTVSSSQSSGAESPSATLAESCAMLDQYGCLTESDRCSWDGKGCVSGEWECSGLSEEVCRFTADKCHVRDGQCRQGAVNSPFRDVLQTDYASHDCNGESSTSVLRLDDCVAYALPDAAGQSMRMVSPCVREGQRVLEVYAEAGCAGAVQTVMLDVGRCVEGVAFECKEPEESEKDSCGALSRYGCSEREECVLEAGGCVLKNSEDEDFVVTPTFPGSETERPLPPTPVPLRRPGGPPSVAPAPPYDGAFFPVGKVAAAGCVVVAAMAAVIALRARRRKQELLVYSRDMTGEKETPPAGAVYGLTSRRSSEQLLVPPPPERRAARMEL